VEKNANGVQQQAAAIQRPPVEKVFASELEKLRATDNRPVPPGWKLSPDAIERFVLGDEKQGISAKFIGSRELITRIIISLITNRGAMLVGMPGTAKSWLSELMSAAISGRSTLIIQGGAIESISQLLYGWNEQVLKTHGPVREALMPGPIFSAMERGQIVRFEELARCSPQIQDALLSILSERQIAIPEMSGGEAILYARQGFNIIGTSNTLDLGVHEMSAALKRRLNFETIEPITHVTDEMSIVSQQAASLIKQSGVSVPIDEKVVECLVTIFHELRNGQSLDGRSTDRLAATVMSTAEAVSVLHALGLYSFYYRDGRMLIDDLLYFLIGATLKDNPEDRRRLKHYFETEVARKEGAHWQRVYQSAKQL
jgi:MoxR-like ATPase